MYIRFIQKLIQVEQLKGLILIGFRNFPFVNIDLIVELNSSKKCSWSRTITQHIVINKQFSIFSIFSLYHQFLILPSYYQHTVVLQLLSHCNLTDYKQ